MGPSPLDLGLPLALVSGGRNELVGLEEDDIPPLDLGMSVASLFGNIEEYSRQWMEVQVCCDYSKKEVRYGENRSSQRLNDRTIFHNKYTCTAEGVCQQPNA